MRCCHTIIFLRVGVYPFDLQRWRGRKTAVLVVWGLPGRRKTLTLDKLDMQLSLSSSYVWNEMRGGRSLTGHTQSWNRRPAPDRSKYLIGVFAFCDFFFFFVIVWKIISYSPRQIKWRSGIKKNVIFWQLQWKQLVDESGCLKSDNLVTSQIQGQGRGKWPIPIC